MRRVEVKRELTSQDSSVIAELLEAAARADGRRALSDHLLLDLGAGGGEGFAAMFVNDDHHGLVAFGQTSLANDARLFETVVHPDHRDESGALEAQLLHAARNSVAATGGGSLNWWVAQPTAAHRSTARRAGLTPSRELLQMRRPLPAEHHATIDTRAFRRGDDEVAWLAVNNRAFAAHGEQGGWTIATLEQRLNEPWFDPAGFRIHERDGRMAGFCWTKVHPGDRDDGSADLGEIYVIAVDPDFHGQGLGTELTLAGLDHLTDAGIRTALLYVDADNAAAVATYRRLGFDVAATNAAFTAHIGDGQHLPSQQDEHS